MIARCKTCRAHTTFTNTGNKTAREKEILKCEVCGDYFTIYSGYLHRLKVRNCIVCGVPIFEIKARICKKCNRNNPCNEDCFHCRFADCIMPMESM